MKEPTVLLLGGWLALCVLWLLALVPLSAEFIFGTGASRRFWAGALVPSHWPERRFWTAAYGLICALMIGLSVAFAGSTKSGVLVLVFGGIGAAQAAVTWFAREIVRTQGATAARARSTTASAHRVPPKSAPAASGLGERLKRFARWVLRITAVLLVIAVGEAIPALKSLEHLLLREQTLALAMTGSIAALGFVAMMGGIIHMVLYGGEAHDEFTFRELKDAFSRGAWRVDLVWRRRLVITAGGLTLSFGLLGIVFVLAGAGVKLLIGAATLYAAFRLGQGLLR